MRLERKDLTPLLRPASIAVIGASERPGAGSFVIENLRALGYGGEILAVNPRYTTVLGLPCYPSLLDVPQDKWIGCIAIVLGYGQVIPILEQAAQRGIRGAWAFASGFAETGQQGIALQEQLRDLCLDHQIMFCGPNCVGYVNLHAQAGTFSAPLSPTLRKGSVAAVAQSGSVILALANSNRGVGFSALVSSGNEAVLDMADYLEFFLEDKNTEIIIAFIEGIRRPEAFIHACDRASRLKKPIIAVKVGRSTLAQKTVVTHTGALAGSDQVHDALFRRLGVVRVDDLDQLLETAELFVRCKGKLPKGNRLGAIAVSGGEIGLIGDLAESTSISFPELSKAAHQELRDKLPPFTAIGNPLDAWGSGDLLETYPACLEVLTQEENIDLIAVSQDSPPGMAERQIMQYADVARAAVRAASNGKPVVVFSHVSGGLDGTIRGILDEGNVPFLQGSRESLLAIHHLIEYAEYQRRRKSEPIEGAPPPHLKEMIEGFRGARRVLSYDKTKELLSAYGIRVAKAVLAGSVEAALKAARDIGYPVAVKAQSPQIPHKTEAGLVRLNIKDGPELSASFEEMAEKVHRHAPEATLEGILIQQMVSPGAVEVILGISRDPSFGPVVALGMGGLLVELLKDVCIQLPPIDFDDVYAMISRLKGRALLQGFRGRDSADVNALAHAVVQVGRMAIELKDVLFSLDLNPLMVLPGMGGVVAADMVLEVGG